MLKRSPFKRPDMPPPRPSRQYEGISWNKARPTVVCVVDTRSVMVYPIEKLTKAKPGKRTPTKAEREWMDKIVAYGCIACRLDGFGHRAPAVHHILRGGRRIGHLFTLPLCDPGHHQNGDALGLVSRHPWKARFEQRYGAELHLLSRLKRELGYFDDWKAT